MDSYAEVDAVETEAEPVTFEGEASGIKVSVVAAADAFPEGTTMAVEAVRAADVRDAVEQAVEGTVARVAAVDITFADAEGAEVQPASPVRVSMSGVDVPSQGEPVVVHLDSEGQGSLVEQAEAEQADVAFEAESFSVYAVAVIWDEEGELVVETDDYVVTVGYTKEAEIPFGTELEVREIERGSDRYEDLWDQTVDKLNEGVSWDNHDLPDPRTGLTDAMFFDVTLRLRDQVIEPKVPLQVSIRYKEGGVLLPEGETAGVVHFGEKGTEVVEDVVVDSSAADDSHLPANLKGSERATGFTCELDGFSPVGTFGTGKIGEGTVSGPAIKLVGAGNPSTAITANKTITDIDGDGVHELALSVTGASESSSSTKVDKSNVVLVIDTSGSMDNDVYTPYTYSADTYDSNTTYYRLNNNGDPRQVWHWPGGNYYGTNHEEGWYRGSYGDFGTVHNGAVYTQTTRIAATKAAAKDLVSILLANNKPAGTVADDGTTLDDIIEISMITFANGTSARLKTPISQSTSLDDISDAIDAMVANGGTNWEAALSQAKVEAHKYDGQTGENTAIIFLTDGVPTRRGYPNEWSSPNGSETRDNTHSAWEGAAPAARSLITDGFTLYNIFSFGTDTQKYDYDNGRTDADYLRSLTNYAYSTGNGTYADTTLTERAKPYFFNAKDTKELTDAFQKIIDSINNTVGYGGVEYDDGLTVGVTSASITVDGTAHPETFRYKVTAKGQDDQDFVVYSVKIDADGEATFTINGQDYVDNEPEEVITKPDKNNSSTWIYSQVYSVEVGGKKYMMSPATIDPDTGMIEWDLAGLGILENNYTYTVAFDVWPNQWSYDLVADLNNGVKTIEQAEDEVVRTKGQAVWDQIRAALIDPTASNPYYAIRTNYQQQVDYYTVTTEEDGEGNVEENYSEKQTKNVTFDDNIALTSKLVPMWKDWNSSLSPDQIGNLLYEDYPENKKPRKYHVTLHLWKADTATELQSLIDQYAGDPATASQHDYLEKTLGWSDAVNDYVWQDSVNIAPGTMISLQTAVDMGLDTTSEQHSANIVTYNNKQYYIIERGHYYYITEDNIDKHFQLETVLYHPMMVDGKLSNVTFGTDDEGNIIVEDIEDLTRVTATNSKTAELDITKKVVDETGKMTQAQMDAETFTYKITLTVPADADMSYTNLFEWVPRPGDTVPGTSARPRYLVYGYQTSEDEDLLGLDDDVARFNEKVYGRYTVSYDYDDAEHTLNHIFFEDAGGTTKTGVIYATLKQNEILRLTNLPSGTQYTIQEIYANLRQADPSRDADAKPTSSDPASNIAAQGYEVSVNTKNGTPTVSRTAVDNDTVTGSIDKLNKRYYNQFTNTRTETPGNLWAEIKVHKVVEGYEWLSEFYRFFLIPGTATYTDAEGGTGTSPIKPTHVVDSADVSRVDLYEDTNDSHVISFGNVQFTRPGTYEYEIREHDNSSNMPYVKFADPVHITVTVERGQDGLLHITGVTDDSGIENNSFVTEATETTLECTTTTMTNKVVPTTADATKEWLDANGRPIPSSDLPDGVTATFELYADGEPTGRTVVLDGVVDEDGELEHWVATFADLPKYVVTTGEDGTTRTYTEIVYTIAETEVSEAFVKVTEDPVPNHGKIQNKQLPIGVSLQKIGNADFENLLSDVSFKLYSNEALQAQVTTDATGNQVGSADGTITTVDGVANIGTLAVGTYYLVETVPAGGYVALTGPVTINVTGTPEGQRVSYQQADFDASMDGRGLFKVYTHEVEGQQQEVKVDCAQDTEDPYAEDEAYTFVGYRITVNNTSGAELPKSGGVGTQLILAIGAGMIAAGALVLFNRRRGLIAL